MISGGPKRAKRNMKPVTLVATVVNRKIAVMGGVRFESSMPNKTSIPDAIPIRLMTTWNCVNAATDMPRIMVSAACYRMHGRSLTADARLLVMSNDRNLAGRDLTRRQSRR